MTSYASFADFKARQSTADDQEATLTELLTAASRLLDRLAFVAAGSFAPTPADEGDADLERTFEITSGPRAFLRDDLGNAHLLRSASAVTLTTTATTTALESTDWRLLRTGDEPGIGLRRLGGKSFEAGVLAVTGRWGWGSTPAIAREAAVMIARDFSDAHSAGAAGTIQVLDDGVPLQTDTQRLIGRLVRQLGRGKGRIR